MNETHNKFRISGCIYYISCQVPVGPYVGFYSGTWLFQDWELCVKLGEDIVELIWGDEISLSQLDLNYMETLSQSVNTMIGQIEQ